MHCSPDADVQHELIHPPAPCSAPTQAGMILTKASIHEKVLAKALTFIPLWKGIVTLVKHGKAQHLEQDPLTSTPTRPLGCLNKYPRLHWNTGHRTRGWMDWLAQAAGSYRAAVQLVLVYAPNSCCLSTEPAVMCAVPSAVCACCAFPLCVCVCVHVGLLRLAKSSLSTAHTELHMQRFRALKHVDMS